jgi:hypothetical protein
MASGSTRLALSKIQLGKKSPTSENEEMKNLTKTVSEKIPLKLGASEHNHSK